MGEMVGVAEKRVSRLRGRVVDGRTTAEWALNATDGDKRCRLCCARNQTGVGR